MGFQTISANSTTWWRPQETPGAFQMKLNLNQGLSHLTNNYPAAYTDFFGMPSRAPCIYRSGPAWPEQDGPEAQCYIREVCPIYGHHIADSWLRIGTDIYQYLDSHSVKWTSIDPVAFANAGERTLFSSANPALQYNL